ncbi:MAG: zinc-ribbon domain containing protein [Candidatus Eremiobacteraeota bacterium]|nr:zinc-ribbon domain containing protein [Candidatus Eremiobacteraeota bacterium]
MYTDETLSCRDCGRSFTFTAGQQEFFASKGFANKPGRCDDCRAAHRNGGGSRGGGGGYGAGGGSRRELFKATCSKCGGVAEVPFEPRTGRPVYCRDCFASQQSTYR